MQIKITNFRNKAQDECKVLEKYLRLSLSFSLAIFLPPIYFQMSSVILHN